MGLLWIGVKLMSENNIIFDRRLLRKRRDRAARLFDDQDELFTSAALELVDRIRLVKRNFPLALNLGTHGGLFERIFDGAVQEPTIGTLLTSDLSPNMILRGSGMRLVADEEMLPFNQHTFDLVISLLTLQSCNDLPGALTQIRRVLRPDGLFLAALFGGETLKELRQVLSKAELEVEGGVSPRIAPSVDVQSMGQLLQRAGFALPVVDIERITLYYDTPIDLIRSLRASGQTNILVERKKSPLRRATLKRACEMYADQFSDNEDRFIATFELLYVLGWAPDPSQQQPLKPGSAKVRLADALNTVEHSAGEKAVPHPNPNRKV